MSDNLGKNNLGKKEISNGIVDMKNDVKSNTKISTMNDEVIKNVKDDSKEAKDDVNSTNSVNNNVNSANSVYNEQISVNLDNIADVCLEWIHLQTPEEIKEFGNYLPERKLINFFIREFTTVRRNIVGTNHFEEYTIRRANGKIKFILATNFSERSIWTRSNLKSYVDFWSKYRLPKWTNFRKYLFREACKDEVLDFMIDFLIKHVEINK